MELENKKILVVGLGKTGVSVSRFLNKRCAVVTVTDISKEEVFVDIIEELKSAGIKMEMGYHNPETFEKSDLIVISPGVPHYIPPVKNAVKKGVPLIGEIELASRYIKEPIVAVTGTNGKTTTTTIIGKMLKECGFDVFVGGNIGAPLIEYVDKGEKKAVVVAEISSFQLDTIDTFKPTVGVLLNISEDHLDRYENYQAYAKSKTRMFENQDLDDIAILNKTDSLVEKIGGKLKNKKYYFNFGNKYHAAINAKNIFFNTDDNGTFTLKLDTINISGKHNYENIAAAALATLAAGGTYKGIQTALEKFKGLSHRIEYVDTINDIEFYNDSKATNTDAVIKALESFKKPVIIIMGGRSKNSNFNVLKQSIKKNVKMLISIGESKDKILSSLGSLTKAYEASTMEEAVNIAYLGASPGDIILLSPACASFDMFDSYAHRGKIFSYIVKKIKEGFSGY